MFSITKQPGSSYQSTCQSSPTNRFIGKSVEQYDILSKLGGGGQGVVYLAKDTQENRLVALKFLLPQWSHDEIARQRFVREARAGSAAEHRNICTIHGIESTDDGQLFIVMAYCEGRTLKRELENGALAIDKAVGIAAQIAEGLGAAHAEGVVHRDVKPGNVMITADGVKILDFGLAKFADQLQLTIQCSLLGTTTYMSPEQLRGEEADARSDVWATGIVLYEMIAGSAPFKGSSPDAVGFAIRNDPPPSLATQACGVSPDLCAIVQRALRKDPRERFQTAGQLARALRGVQESGGQLAWPGRVLTRFQPARTRGAESLPARTVFLTAAGVANYLRPLRLARSRVHQP